MRDEIALCAITQADHSEDVLDLAMRAADYVTLEIGRAPDEDYVADFFNAAPPDLSPDCLIHLAVMEGPAMVGTLCIAEGYEYPDDWWIGLLLIDPAFRSQRIGHTVVQAVKKRAADCGVNMLKLSVLKANTKVQSFWQRQGFIHHRDAPATRHSDGHDRVVLKFQL